MFLLTMPVLCHGLFCRSEKASAKWDQCIDINIKGVIRTSIINPTGIAGTGLFDTMVNPEGLHKL